MKTLKLYLLSVITLTIITNAQTVIPPGYVSGTWTLSGSPFKIEGEITIGGDTTLTIEPGVVVEFQGHYKLNVEGRLLAIGTVNDTIIFTVNDTTGFFNPEISDGGWHGIRFYNPSPTNDSSKIVYCRLEFGKAIGLGYPDDFGGAILVDNFDKLLVSDCLITHNKAVGGSWPGGGGISLWSSAPVIINNTFLENKAVLGGGIQCFESTPVIQNNIIINNVANRGGGIACTGSNITIINTRFENNGANYGGGINSGNNNVYVNNCTFTGNNAVMTGGALNYVIDETFTGAECNLIISSSDFTSNQAQSRGGGVFIAKFNDTTAVSVAVDKCKFIGNTADYHSGLKVRGKISSIKVSDCFFKENMAVRFTGALSFTDGVSGEVNNCIFAANTAATGGGNWNAGGVSVYTGANIDFMNCTFADNAASFGAGLTVGSEGSATVTNCIFWGNGTDQIAIDTLYGLGASLTVNYSDVQGGENSVNIVDTSLCTLFWGDGNIDADPIFADTMFRLSDTSPCLESGVDSIEIDGAMHYCPLFCYDGVPRPSPTGTSPDMGACENPVVVGVMRNLYPVPGEYSLFQNFPNPFNPLTTLKYSVPKRSLVQINIYDVLGNEITTLVNEEKPAGTYELTWYAENLPSGVYFYQLKAGEFIETKKMMLMK